MKRPPAQQEHERTEAENQLRRVDPDVLLCADHKCRLHASTLRVNSAERFGALRRAKRRDAGDAALGVERRGEWHGGAVWEPACSPLVSLGSHEVIGHGRRRLPSLQHRVAAAGQPQLCGDDR